MKIFNKLFYIFSVFIVIFSVLIASLTVLLNTPWGKKKLIDQVAIYSKDKEINLSFDKLSGALPFKFTLYNVKLQLDENKSIQIGKISFRPSYSKLLKKTLSFKTMKAFNIQAIGFDKLSAEGQKGLFDRLDFGIQIKNFSLRNLKIDGLQGEFNLNGKVRVETDFSYLSISSQISRVAFPDSYLDVKVRASKDRFFQLNLSADIKNINSLKPYLDIPIKNKSNFKVYLNGPWESFTGLLENNTKNLADFSGAFNVFVEEFENVSSPMATDIEIKGNIFLNPDGNIFLSDILAFNDYFDAKGLLTLTSFKELQKANLFYNIYSIEDLKYIKLLSPLKGRFNLERKEMEYLFSFRGGVSSFLLNDLNISDSDMTFNGNVKDNKISGKYSMESTFQNRKLQLFSNIAQNDSSLNLSKISLKSDFFNANGNLEFFSQDKIIGRLNLGIEDISMLEMAFPKIFIDGSAKAKVNIDTVQNNSIDISMKIADIEYGKVGTSYGNVDLVVNSPFNNPTFEIKAKLGPSKIFNTTFQSVLFSTEIDQQNWPFEIITTGKNIDANINGFWKLDEKSFNINVQDFFGTVYNQSFFLVEPIYVDWLKDKEFKISDFVISMEDAFLKGGMSLSPNAAFVKLEAENFPIDFITLNTLELSIQGMTTGNMLITYDKGNVNGQFDFRTKNTKFYTPDDSEEIVGVGKISGKLKNNVLEVSSNFQSEEEELLKAFFSFGIQVEPFPLKISFLRNSPFKGNLSYNARAEDLLDFFDLGFNFLRGDLKCDLSFDGTISAPNITGMCSLSKGTYENYLAGVHLKNINADIIGNNNKLEIVKLTANGVKGGNLNGFGELILDYEEHFPYVLNADLDSIQLVKLDYIEGKLQGKVQLKGNTKQAVLTGDALIKEAEVSIPEGFKSRIPSLSVTYVNAPEDFESPIKKEKFIFYLDVYLNAPKNVFLRGRGLTAELKGEIKLEGSINNLITKGHLDLVKGDFLFSGHSFDLTKGEFVFGEEGALPFLFLSAQTNIQGITITATLSGQLDSPTLDFKSMPPLPLSSILSYLLFGSDISEISALQAVTLASTAASLAGGSTDILEATRKKLGVDRLAVISSPGSTGEEDFAVQIGKYVAKGVLISFSQGVEQGSTNIVIEVDLKHGFVFSAESIQQEEQGRFSLKWNRNF